MRGEKGWGKSRVVGASICELVGVVTPAAALIYGGSLSVVGTDSRSRTVR